jgi:hypothetical protein
LGLPGRLLGLPGRLLGRLALCSACATRNPSL